MIATRRLADPNLGDPELERGAIGGPGEIAGNPRMSRLGSITLT
jgi:hypothetical protein